MAELNNVVVTRNGNKLVLTIDMSQSVGQTKDGRGIYRVNTHGPVEIPDMSGTKIALALWQRE